MINTTVEVDSGMSLKKVEIKASHVGLRLGDLVHTKVVAFYKKGG